MKCKRDSWFRINKDGENNPGPLSDTPKSSRDAEARCRQLSVGTFEDEDFKRAYKKCNGNVGRIGVNWESDKHGNNA